MRHHLAGTDQAVTDHADLGRRLEIFDTVPSVGAGLPLWLPDGAVIRAELETLAMEKALASGCRRVYTPVLAKRELFERSGHWEKFSEDMFPEMNVGGESFVLRPANCPHHTQVFAAVGRSYRDLPFRLAELGSMFRSELSGVLGGLSRVRQINLDDAHSFCTSDQAVDEIRLALLAIADCYRILDIDIQCYRLSTRGADGGRYLGSDEQWQRAEGQLRTALNDLGLEYREAPGEAAFYGPKIDVQVADARGRAETLSTVQIDYNQPERFRLSYVGRDGGRHRPVMIHRGLLSSMERLTALLIERHDGRMPTWLAPVQVRVLPVGERHLEAAGGLASRMRAAGLRAQVSGRGTLGNRVRESRHARDAYLAIIGDDEVAERTVSVIAPGVEEKGRLPSAEFIARLSEEIRDRSKQPRALRPNGG